MPTATDEFLYTCDRCSDTVLSTRRALVLRWGWKRYRGKREGIEWTLFLCPECQPKRKQ